MKAGIYFITLCAIALAIGGCQTVVSERVEDSLIEVGVPSGMATCMGDIWADDLSISQIRGIQRFARGVKAEGRQLTAGRLIAHAREWNDLEALAVVTTSTARCAFS
ncbi:hypothetical protein GRI62_01090 [Erythrobacter arachoides]|uniref:Lipoprotein n=1 Tax=Aurantiacibacter arachoides TaxID=1850444 RepID=A0A844ZV57_9SPHN|nr:hypothetical protein [Aurantiacibacter arachoides]MXO92201.1 hypothetical protein [Aurantiacibacter arachoides]GGD58891.1 hypothetical protein GCM10011411_18900 [Aurantiacibacter arachoides]